MVWLSFVPWLPRQVLVEFWQHRDWLQSALSAEQEPTPTVQFVPLQVSLTSQHWLPWLQSPLAMAHGTQIVWVSFGPWLPRHTLVELKQQPDTLQSPLSAAQTPASACEHTLLMQTWPKAQALPQLPQFWLSLVMFTQLPLQEVKLPVQTVVQAPAVQVAPCGQALPQVPQLALSVEVFVHWPLHWVPASAQPVPQVPLAQT